MKVLQFPIFLLLTLSLIACPLDTCDTAVGPSATPPSDDVNEPEPIADKSPDRVDRSPNLSDLHIFTFFSATITYDAEAGYKTLKGFNSQYMLQVIQYMMEKGFNTGRVGAGVDGWCDNGVFYLPCGPPALTDEWKENLIGMLEITSRVPGFYVQLIPTFTHKGDDCGLRCLEALTRAVMRIVENRGYKHVVWEAFNEFVHPSTAESDNDSGPWWQKKSNLRPEVLTSILRILPHPRGTDFPDNGGDGADWRGRLRTAEVGNAASYCDYIAWHPSRNPEPTVDAYMKTMSQTAKPVVFDETVSWISIAEQGMVNKRHSNFTQGTEDEMREQVERQQQALCDAGATCSYHALWLFGWDRRIDYAPNCPCN